ncbi:MAG: hypothetical protein COU07_00230 [Candidatus Harrisonbacteria bacterium CG10_big_fil_rev_8_21_14_0_10_40_38]|uniref:Uncharacterized protein n=1 Tax=Candidatus Harrisonbacteria bacterium CG10_big_fil_rev_8_21_14_0_10_40_38 TaxID=1974583 RepID=A0A2H0USC0_9BACT|nr:MAG: hypothetical protein COU07_00230 [Candidatus Harrisonbacteria bacterium CG10_big_fil_rev_8_21_14_0_10_40_38]
MLGNIVRYPIFRYLKATHRLNHLVVRAILELIKKKNDEIEKCETSIMKKLRLNIFERWLLKPIMKYLDRDVDEILKRIGDERRQRQESQ